ncbi:MAG: hypothetical protein ACTSPB_00770 [Candidatus Thorarchaeota archaeon]
MVKKHRGSGWHGEAGRHRMAQLGIKTVDAKGGKVRVQDYLRSGEVTYFKPLGASGVAVDGLMSRLSPVGQKFLMASGEAIGSESQLFKAGTHDETFVDREALAEEQEAIAEEKKAHAEKKVALAEEKERIKEDIKVTKARVKSAETTSKLEKAQEKLALVEAETKLAQARARKTEARAEQLGALFKPVVGAGEKAVTMVQALRGEPTRAVTPAMAVPRGRVPSVGTVKSDRMQRTVSSHSKATREGIASIGGDTVPKVVDDITFDEITAYKSGLTVDVDAIMNITENKKRLIELASHVEKDTEEIRMFRDEVAHKNRAENEKTRKDFFAYEGDNTHKLEKIYDSMIGSSQDVSENTKNAYRKKKAEILRDIEVKRAEARKSIAQNKYDVEWIDRRYGAFKEVYSKLWKKAKEV